MNKKTLVFGSLVFSIIAAILLLPLLIWAPVLSQNGYYTAVLYESEIACYLNGNRLYMFPYTDSYQYHADIIDFQNINGRLSKVDISKNGYKSKMVLINNDNETLLKYEMIEHGEHRGGITLRMQGIYNPLTIYYLVFGELFFSPEKKTP